MKKKVAIIGAGISGLIFANFLKQNSNYDFNIYEKNSSLDLNQGYGIQLSTNSISLLNKIGFSNLKKDDKFNPKKIEFHLLKNNKKICELDISQFNFQNTCYTTLKRSLLIEFLRRKLFTNSIQFNKKVEKISCSNSKVEITFEKKTVEIFDYLVIADGVFSSTKSILFNRDIKPKYFGSLAIRALLEQEDLNFFDKNNIILFLGSNIHLVSYPINIKKEVNIIAVIRKNLDQKTLTDESFFNDKENIKKVINDSLIKTNVSLRNLLNNAKDLKCFPIFTSDRMRQANQKNIFFLGDALYAIPPTFAQGASQSIESAYELFNILKEDKEGAFDKYYFNRTKRIKMINSRSKLNYFIFHLSNPIFVLLRNLALKIAVKNKSFLNKYLGNVYFRN